MEHTRVAHAMVQLGLVELPMVTDWVVMEPLLAAFAVEEGEEQQGEDETRHGGGKQVTQWTNSS